MGKIHADVDERRQGCWYDCIVSHRVRIADGNAGQLELWGPSAGTPRVRHSTRARRLAVKVHLDGSVELVVPRGVSRQRAQAFFDSQRQWVTRQVQRRDARLPASSVFPPSAIDLPAIGERWGVHLGAGSGRARIVAIGASCISLQGEADATQWRHLLRAWLAQRARQAFAPRLAQLAMQHGFGYQRMSIRFQRSRWGSCSTRGTISLNLALLFQPPEILRYLMCHELAHTCHMNHSTAFWRCVAACEPRWRQLDHRLDEGWRLVPRWLMRTGDQDNE